MILTCWCKVNSLTPHQLAPVQGGHGVEALDAQVDFAFGGLERLALLANKQLVGREWAQRIIYKRLDLDIEKALASASSGFAASITALALAT